MQDKLHYEMTTNGVSVRFRSARPALDVGGEEELQVSGLLAVAAAHSRNAGAASGTEARAAA